MDDPKRQLLPDSDLGMPWALLGLIIPHVMCTVIVCARLVARLVFLRKWFLDDSVIVAAYLFATAVCVIYSVASQRPDVLHADEVALQAAMTEADWAVHPYILRTYLGLLFYQVCLCLTKLSILTFYLRLFSSSRPYRRTVWCTIAWVIGFGVPMLFMSIFQCHPGPGLFFGRRMYCFALEDLLIASTSCHVLTDAWLLLMIMPSISGLDIPTKQKLTLSVVLNFGVFVITAGVVRLALSLRKDYRPDMAGVTNSLAFFIMTVLECDLAIICASAPTLRPLFAGFAPWIMIDARRKSLQPKPSVLSRSRGRPSAPAAPAVASVNLTGRVSYDGYPWTEPPTPAAESRDPTPAGRPPGRLTKKKRQHPASLSASHRSPTSVSLRSIMSMGPGRPARLDTVTSDGRPILGCDTSRPPSGHDEQQSIGIATSAPLSPLSPPAALGQQHHDWRNSEESLVVGMNDPVVTALSPAPAHRRGSPFVLYGDAGARRDGRRPWDDANMV